jgi:hypothetical protein
MREIIAALAMIILTTSQAALAQPTPGTDPTGSFRLTFPDGWEHSTASRTRS